MCCDGSWILGNWNAAKQLYNPMLWQLFCCGRENTDDFFCQYKNEGNGDPFLDLLLDESM